MTVSIRRLTRPLRWHAVIVALAIAIVVSLLSPSGRHQWALSLIRQPTSYTALFFNRAWALPAVAVSRQPIEVSFTVINHEGRAIDYRYVLEVSSGGRPRILKESSRIVAIDRKWTVSVVVHPVCTASPCRIEVSLPGHPET